MSVVDECLGKVENRFQLVILASRRARQISTGVSPKIESKDHKPTIIALKEIALGLVTAEEIRSINLNHLEVEKFTRNHDNELDFLIANDID